MVTHAARDHATWSASATERNWNCPGALALTMRLPETTSEAADWGTCCHQLSEKCLRSGKDANDFLGTIEKGKRFENEVDEEMAETAQLYVDYVRKRMADYKADTGQDATLWIEQKFSLESLKPPFDAGGTGDAVIYFPGWETIEVVDLKGGRGVVVEVDENKQTRTYALGAMLKNVGLHVSLVKATIVQPRAPHKNGRIRSETFHVADLVEWTADLLHAMSATNGALHHRKDGQLTEAEWSKRYLKPGPHCSKTFCGAAGFCPALQKKAYDDAGVWFDDQDNPRLANSPDAMSPEALASALDAADLIDGWVNAVRAHAHHQAESGVTIPNYILVPKEGRESWIDAAAGEKAAAIASKAGLENSKVFNPGKIKTPKQLRDALVKAKIDKAAGLLTGLSAKADKGTNLVRSDKTTREAVPASVNKHFDVLD